MPPRVTAEGVPGQQRRVHDHDDRADTNAELAAFEERGQPLPPQTDDQKQRAVERVAVQVLKDQERAFSTIAEWHAAHCAVRRPHERGLVVGAAVVVAGDPERDGERRCEERRRLRKERRPPGRERTEPGVIERYRAGVAGGRREERRRDCRTDVWIEPDVRRVERAKRQIAEEENETDRG